MNASLQFFEEGTRVGILRVHPDGIEYPGTFSWVVVVTAEGDTAKIHAAVRPPTKAERDAFKKVLMAHGFKKVIWDRRTAEEGVLRHKAKVAFRDDKAEV
jgi:hypothetical protein